MDLKILKKVRDSVTSLKWIEITPFFFPVRGLFISIHDRGHIASVLNAWPEDVIKVS